MSNSKHEAVCERCGRCCLNKCRSADGTVFLTGTTCDFQDPKTNLCTIYAHRLGMQISAYRCMTHEEALAARIYPNDCPYVRDIKGYHTDIPYPAKGNSVFDHLTKYGAT